MAILLAQRERDGRKREMEFNYWRNKTGKNLVKVCYDCMDLLPKCRDNKGDKLKVYDDDMIEHQAICANDWDLLCPDCQNEVA